MAEEKKETEGESKPKSKKKLIIIIAVVLLLVGGGGGFFLMSGSSEDDASKHEEVEKPPVFKKIKLDPIIVNLSEAKSFLKVSMLLEYDADALTKAFAHGEGGGAGHGGGGSGGEAAAPEGGFPPEIIEKEPVVKDTILRILSSKTTADVLTVNGKQALKEELIEAVNEAIEAPEPIIVNIYFIEFIIQ